jgi:hypothetical protein
VAALPGAALRFLLALELRAMPPFLYSCPGQTVQGIVAEEVPSDSYESVFCSACRQPHFVNPERDP